MDLKKVKKIAKALVDAFKGISPDKTKMWGKEFNLSPNIRLEIQWAVFLCDEMLSTAPDNKDVEQNKRYWEQVKIEITKL